MPKLDLETFSIFSGSTMKNPNFSEFHIISLIIENAQVDFKSEIYPQRKDLHEILCGSQLLSCELKF